MAVAVRPRHPPARGRRSARSRPSRSTCSPTPRWSATSDGILIGAGDTRFLMFGMLAAALGVFVPVALLSLALDWGIVGVWAGLVGLIAVRLATCAWRFSSRRWALVGAPRR